MKNNLSLVLILVFAGDLFAATPANDEPTDEIQTIPQLIVPVDKSKPPITAPATTFTPSEKVGADSAVSFPVDI